MPKTYSLQFKINSIDYTANLLDIDLTELIGILKAGFDPENPATLITRAKLREVEKYLNDSDITPTLPDLTRYSDLNDRMNLFKAVGAVQLMALKDANPDWASAITADQVKLIEEYESATTTYAEIASFAHQQAIAVADDDETMIAS